jgi:hypothetical protein
MKEGYLMAKIKNADVRDAVNRAGLRLWEIAEQLKVSDANFSRMMRHEFAPEMKERILSIISALTQEQVQQAVAQ